MPQTTDHLQQAATNLKVLAHLNQTLPTAYDWQVTLCFYTAVHLVNAHLAQSSLQQRSHFDTLQLINPHKLGVPVQFRLSETAFDAYRVLQSLSRRARYLVNEKDGQLSTDTAAWTHAKHTAKAFRHLDTLLDYFQTTHKMPIPTASLQHEGLSKNAFKVLKIV